jgi:hypothetical protein
MAAHSLVQSVLTFSFAAAFMPDCQGSLLKNRLILAKLVYVINVIGVLIFSVQGIADVVLQTHNFLYFIIKVSISFGSVPILIIFLVVLRSNKQPIRSKLRQIVYVSIVVLVSAGSLIVGVLLS